MTIIRWKADVSGTPGQMVRISPREALQLIASLSQQMVDNAPNDNRMEFLTSTGEYFSIAVHAGRSL
jgi:hypothetical protein